MFFFNFPFREAVMTRVVGNIERSLAAHPRRAFLVFVNPETAHVVDRSPVFEPFITDKYFRIWINSKASCSHGLTCPSSSARPRGESSIRRIALGPVAPVGLPRAVGNSTPRADQSVNVASTSAT